ncbi:MAG: alpha-L-glutamate ligase-like protein [Gammaproteobacteria bacterium]
MLIRRWQALRKAGVIGINERNRNYIMAKNPRKLYALVDDKVRTKTLAQQANIAVPELYGLIKSPHDARNFRKVLQQHQDYVIKPARGSGGNGILVITGTRKDRYIRSDGAPIDDRQIEHHIQNILGGVYSLGGQPDHAIIEYRVKFDPVFETVSFRGVPDIRVIVYRGIPAMAMLRLPTKKSDGRANLHQGAVGVGIDMRRGCTTSAVCDSRRIEEHPDFGNTLTNIVIPHWQDILLLAAKCQELAPLGYLGVDIVLDAEFGALMLELNARPGLAIQIANGRGLGMVLDRIDAVNTDNMSAQERAELTGALVTPTPEAA